jgi:hypothetical protein
MKRHQEQGEGEKEEKEEWENIINKIIRLRGKYWQD